MAKREMKKLTAILGMFACVTLLLCTGGAYADDTNDAQSTETSPAKAKIKCVPDASKGEKKVKSDNGKCVPTKCLPGYRPIGDACKYMVGQKCLISPAFCSKHEYQLNGQELECVCTECVNKKYNLVNGKCDSGKPGDQSTSQSRNNINSTNSNSTAQNEQNDNNQRATNKKAEKQKECGAGKTAVKNSLGVWVCKDTDETTAQKAKEKEYIDDMNALHAAYKKKLRELKKNK